MTKAENVAADQEHTTNIASECWAGEAVAGPEIVRDAGLSAGRRGGWRPPLLPRGLRDDLLRRVARGDSDACLAEAFGLTESQIAKLRYNHAAKIRRIEGEAPPSPGLTADDSLPVQAAFALLGERVERLRGGFFRLDGRPAGLKHIMATANCLRVGRGKPAIPYPGVLPMRPLFRRRQGA